MPSSRPRLSLAERFASSPLGSLYFLHVTTRLDPWLLKRTDGRYSSLPGQPVLLLQHTGARSGEARETPLVYALDGDDIVLIASYGGSPRNPAWYHNLKANPHCHVIARGRTGRYEATEVEEGDYERVWAKAVEVYGGYAVYRQRARTRRIPLLRLRRLPQP